MLMLTPVVAMLHNEKTGRWHPILFRNAPFPGEASGAAAPRRLRSKAHHTDGFALRDAAVASADQIAGQCGAQCLLDGDLEWDGEDVPAMHILVRMDGDRVLLAL